MWRVLILVTGATGTVGREVVSSLLKRGIAVRVGSRDPDKAATFAREQTWNVEVAQFDYGDEASMREALRDVDGVFLVTTTTVHAPEAVLGPFLQVAKEAEVEHIVRLSGMRTLEEPSRLHREAEKLIEASIIPYTHLRPNFFMQNFNTFYAKSIKKGGFYLPAGNGKVSFIDTRDVGEVAAVAFTETGHEGKTYTLTGGEALTHGEVANVLSDVLGYKVTYVSLSDEQTYESMRKLGRPDAAIAGIIDLYKPAKDGSAGKIGSETETLLGHAPTSFRQYAEDYKDVWTH